MTTYKVLLVDDEEEVRNAIEQRINWEELGFEVIGKAQNGVKAMEIAEKLQPDVVITDIKMPYMNGLELARNLKEENPGVRILILTGFDEFEYAKEAVHLEIEEYILKPVNANELSECLKRLKNVLDKEREEKLNVRKLEQYYTDSLPVLQTNFFCSLVEGRISDSEINKYLNDYQISLPGPYFCCAVFHTSENHVPDGMTPLLLSISVQREVKEKFRGKWDCRYFSYLGNIVMVVNLGGDDEITRLTDDCDRFCKWADRFFGAVVTVGIGKVCNEVSNLRFSYEGAWEALSYRVIYGSGCSINIADIAPKGQGLSMQPDDINMNDVFKAVHIGVREDIEHAVFSLVKELKDNAKTIMQYNFTVLEIVGHLYRFCGNNHMKFEDHAGEIKNAYEEITKMDESALLAWLVRVALSISDELKNARNSSLRYLISEAKNIVRDEYADADLSLDTVCSKLGVSNSYFSSIFKKEVGISLYYGVGNMDEDDQPKIIVKGWKDDAEIYLSVTDNGMGMRHEDVENILKDNQKGPKHGSGVGLINVHTRIQLMFGNKYGLIVESEPDEGTTVTIHLPAVPYTKENCEVLETPGKPVRKEGES